MNNSMQKIIDKIAQDAKSFDETALREAEAAAVLIRDDYKSQAEAAAAVIADKAGKNVEHIVAKAESRAERIKMNAVLTAKHAILDDVFNIAVERIISSDDAQYLKLMTSMAIRAAESIIRAAGNIQTAGEGVIFMNKNDSARFGKKLVDQLSKEKKTSVKFILSKESADIRGGFILRCGDVDVNCSVESVVASMRRNLEPRVISTLFE